MLLAGTVTNNNIDLKKENSIGDQEYALIQKVQDKYFCYIVNPYVFNVKWTYNFKAFYAGFPEAPGWIYLKANEA
jgi:hypothetical protein